MKYNNVIEYKAALRDAKAEATLKLVRLKAKEKALGLVRLRMDKLQLRMDEVTKEVSSSENEYFTAWDLVSSIKAEWLSSVC